MRAVGAVDALASILKDNKVPASDDVAGRLRGLLTDPAADVRNRAIAALGAIGDRQAVSALIELAGKPDDGASMRRQPWRKYPTFVPCRSIFAV